MKVFAISDLHLSLHEGMLQKPQDRFGAEWKDHHKQIEADWVARVGSSDLVLVAGDISWALRLADAREDLLWLDQLPGKKVIVEGNHDWWMPPSAKKTRAALPPSISMVHRDAMLVGDMVLFGTRLWRIPGLDFPTDPIEEVEAEDGAGDAEHDRRMLLKEIERLKLSIASAKRLAEEHRAAHKICLTHFPPLDFSGHTTEAADLLAAFGTDTCVFGHVHGLKPGCNGISVQGCRYYLTSCDYLGFRLLELPS